MSKGSKQQVRVGAEEPEVDEERGGKREDVGTGTRKYSVEA